MLQSILESNLASTVLRLFLAMVFGGILGIERGRKKRPAGFRTYMLVCVGSALVMITNVYICELYPGSDPSRMGAQVISGIGFLGAGTIIVTGRNRVKGLTTAAGLWAAACVGLTLGIGYYSAAIIGSVLIFSAMALLHSLDQRVMASTKIINLYIEFQSLKDIGIFMEYAKGQHIHIGDLEMIKPNGIGESGIAALMTLRLEKKTPHYEIIKMLSEAKGISCVEEV